MITKKTREVFYSEAANKSYFTLKAAIRNEAKARVTQRLNDDNSGYVPMREYLALVKDEEARIKDLLAF